MLTFFEFEFEFWRQKDVFAKYIYDRHPILYNNEQNMNVFFLNWKNMYAKNI